MPEGEESAVALYHRVYESEGYEESVRILLRIVRHAKEVQPGKKRILFLDIDGHRNPAGGFDSDMFELQTEFLLKHLMPFLSEVHYPLGTCRNVVFQREDVPDVAIFVLAADA